MSSLSRAEWLVEQSNKTISEIEATFKNNHKEPLNQAQINLHRNTINCHKERIRAIEFIFPELAKTKETKNNVTT